MVKYYCDKCGKELPKAERYRAELRISGFASVTDRLDLEYCEDCLAEIVGKDKFTRLLELKAERQKRAEERKKARMEDEYDR